MNSRSSRLSHANAGSLGALLPTLCRVAAGSSLLLLAAGCSGSDGMDDDDDTETGLAHSVFVAGEGSMLSYGLADAAQRAGTVQNVSQAVDMQALDDGTVMVNLTDQGQILVVDPSSMLEIKRIPSSSMGATRPVHSLISDEKNGKKYWISLNDGVSGDASTDSALFVDIEPSSSTYLAPVGEVGLGVGHHKAAFSSTLERVVISNISDCDNVMSVYDYSDISDIKTLATLTAEQVGFDGSSYALTCDPTYQAGQPPSPHGCATSILSGMAYCNVTATGDIVVVDIDAATPTFKRLPTSGHGGGYTTFFPGGRYIYSLEEHPREGDNGVDCQIGQLVVVDASQDKVIKELPLLYTGPDCTDKLAGTDEESAEPGHMLISHDEKTMYIATAGAFGDATARVRQELVIDLADPADPQQKLSIPVGTSTSHFADTLSGDGKFLFTVGNIDNTLTQIDTATNRVTHIFPLSFTPEAIATFGAIEGAGHQTGPLE